MMGENKVKAENNVAGGVKEEVKQITIKVKSQANEEVEFRIKKHTALTKVFQAYAQKAGQTLNVLRFKFDGETLDKNDDKQTAETLGLEEGDVIDAFITQIGGK